MAIAIVLRLFPLILLCLSAPAYADIFDMSEHSGIIRDSNGNYSQVSANGSIRSLTNSTTLAITEKVNFPTSKGVFAADITRNAIVDLARIGKTVRSVAVATGPVGLTLTAVSLVCELTSICNQGGSWFTTQFQSLPPSDSGLWRCSALTSQQGTIDWCKANFWGCNSPNRVCSGDVVLNNGTVYQFKMTQPSDGFVNGYADLQAVVPWVPQPVGSTATTASDWDSKESLLNDQRFVEPLVTGNHPVPIQSPTITTPIKKPISKETTTIKDGAGNTTGTEETTTEAEISDPSSAENPSNNPNLIKISETTIKNTYNLNNQLTNSTTTVSDGAQKPEPQSIKIEIDDMQDTPLQTYQVPVTFAYDSWGSGTCPADRSVEYHYGSLNLTFQPACDFAVGMQPVILVVAGMIAMFIVSGVRLND